MRRRWPWHPHLHDHAASIDAAPRHAVIEQLLANLSQGRLPTPSAIFSANAAYLTIVTIACTLVRAAGGLAGRRYAGARAAAICRDLIAVASGTASRGCSRLTLHLREGPHDEREWLNFFETACGSPAAAA